ncbi:methionyl-tRNA formyltransferase [Mesoplasma photuris]|uniref:methionyl-tRNA formyltransferase n=1 Tax=Mesoplasma photuris TaxID=217731 RepID=UPI0004E0DC80|nr:methionyl-tRNA formyltransferase [Mesoplasma photuris]
MNKIKVIFCGTPKIGAGILSTLIEMKNVDVIAVISQPDKMVGRNKVLTPTPVKKVAQENNIRIFQPSKISEIFDELSLLDYDFLVTCAYGQFVPTKILNLAKIDSINVHGSLLPKYRGGAPIQYAIKNGDSKTGISIMKMVKEMDAGGYYIQEEIDIEDKDDAGSLFEKMTLLGSKMIKENLEKIYVGELKLVDQDESKVTFSKNISTEEEKIDWSKSARDIFNHIRSLSPNPIAHTFINDQRYKIKSSRVLNNDELVISTMNIKKVGEIINFDNEGIIVHTSNGLIKILEIQRPGKQMIDAGLYKKNNLNDLKIGDIFK